MRRNSAWLPPRSSARSCPLETGAANLRKVAHRRPHRRARLAGKSRRLMRPGGRAGRAARSFFLPVGGRRGPTPAMSGGRRSRPARGGRVIPRRRENPCADSPARGSGSFDPKYSRQRRAARVKRSLRRCARPGPMADVVLSTAYGPADGGSNLPDRLRLLGRVPVWPTQAIRRRHLRPTPDRATSARVHRVAPVLGRCDRATRDITSHWRRVYRVDSSTSHKTIMRVMSVGLLRRPLGVAYGEPFGERLTESSGFRFARACRIPQAKARACPRSPFAPVIAPDGEACQPRRSGVRPGSIFGRGFAAEVRPIAEPETEQQGRPVPLLAAARAAGTGGGGRNRAQCAAGIPCPGGKEKTPHV
jgi:hypothetical protein